ncbi:hypothetical protein GHT06_012367 [Daphnia sinensis]|nr:hypothetical protein GHT06_012367 [Daphnia sinensis]CAH0109436.1 unnamed protein product [Daphnia galeata]
MEAILESNKSLWKRTGNMALVVVGALSIFLASVEEVHLDLEQFWTDLGVPSLLQRILPYVAAG